MFRLVGGDASPHPPPKSATGPTPKLCQSISLLKFRWEKNNYYSSISRSNNLFWGPMRGFLGVVTPNYFKTHVS